MRTQLSRPPARSRAAWRANALGLRALSRLWCILFAAGWVAPWLHFALVEHATCAAHGEVVHVGASQDAERPGALVVASATQSRWWCATSNDDPHDHDASCNVQAVPQTLSRLLEAPHVAGRTAGRQRAGFLPHSNAAPHRAALALAPKTSPPAAHADVSDRHQVAS